MRIRFEELSEPKRAGGIEASTAALKTAVELEGYEVTRSSAGAFTAEQAECVHSHGIWSPRLARCLSSALKRGIPCVVTTHGMLDPWPLKHKALKKKLAWHVYQRSLLNKADVLHATSVQEAEQFRKLGLRPPISVIPWGVDVPSARPKRSNSDLRTAMFLGRIFPVKGLPMLIEAWSRVRPQGWRLLIAGPDEDGHQAELETQIKMADLCEQISFAGSIASEAKSEAFETADLFMLPTHSENFGIVVAEALAHGVPVITTKGAPWQLLETERCGWWTPISVDGIAAALREATTKSPEELATMGARGRKVVGERFAWPAIAQQFIQLYEEIVRK